MSLNKKLKTLQDEVLNSLPSDVSKSLILEDEELFSRFLEDKALKEGTKVPDVLFHDENLKPVYLKELLEYNHLVLSFFRGTWCPYCNLELSSLAKIKDKIEAKGARLIAVTPELYKYSEEKLKQNKIDFSVLTDLRNSAANEFGLVFELPPEYREIYKKLNIYLNVLNGDDKWILPMPATFIISKEGVITSAYINANYMQRMEPDDILEKLDLLSPE